MFNQDEFTSLFSYSISLSFDQIKSLGKTFLECENIDEQFNLFNNLFHNMKISISKKSKKVDISQTSKIELEYKDDKREDAQLRITCPLTSGKCENLILGLERKDMDFRGTFDSVVKKYLERKERLKKERITTRKMNGRKRR